jgi:hypothetical protein
MAALGEPRLAERRSSCSHLAEWPGHSVDVLLRVYARCSYGQQYEAKRRIEEATRPQDGD